MSEELQVLTLIAAFGRSADSRDWETAQSAFARNVFVDYSSLFGGTGQTVASADLIKDWQALLPGFTRTQHTIGLPAIAVSGRSAHASAPFLAHHFIHDPAPGGGNT